MTQASRSRHAARVDAAICAVTAHQSRDVACHSRPKAQARMEFSLEMTDVTVDKPAIGGSCPGPGRAIQRQYQQLHKLTTRAIIRWRTVAPRLSGVGEVRQDVSNLCRMCGRVSLSGSGSEDRVDG